MQAFRFKTRVSKDGVIQLPLKNKFGNKEVEVIILADQENRQEILSTSAFVDKWSGFLLNPDTDDSKYQYLSGKYK
jgi:hypothetical protein